MPTWPASIPQTPQAGQWTGSPQPNRAEFRPDVGPAIVRRRASSSVREYSASFPPMTAAQLATFEAWYEDDLYDGSLPFNWADPDTGVTYSWRFLDSYQVTSEGGEGLFMMNCKLQRLS